MFLGMKFSKLWYCLLLKYFCALFHGENHGYLHLLFSIKIVQKYIFEIYSLMVNFLFKVAFAVHPDDLKFHLKYNLMG